MTNKIDELWGKALDKAVPDTYSSLTWTQVERIKTVFAELIVKECAGVELYWLNEQDRKAVAEKIKKHFGVEE